MQSNYLMYWYLVFNILNILYFFYGNYFFIIMRGLLQEEILRQWMRSER